MQIIVNVPNAGKAVLAGVDKLEVTVRITSDSDKLIELLEEIVDHSQTTYHWMPEEVE